MGPPMTKSGKSTSWGTTVLVSPWAGADKIRTTYGGPNRITGQGFFDLYYDGARWYLTNSYGVTSTS